MNSEKDSNTTGISPCKVNPSYLHANSTSHTWVFSAFAEIIDNAYDPDVSATSLYIDKEDIGGNTCLVFQDDGAGLHKDNLLKMLSFGFCEKYKYENGNTHQPIGQYGNGFKSGSMRIGSDALVLTLFGDIASIGFLSQTYLKAIGAESVIVPILEYYLPELEHDGSQESHNNLNAILKHSVFNSEDKLKEQLRSLKNSRNNTKIIIFNLKRMKDGKLELDFSSDTKDIQCPEADPTSAGQATSKYRTSLRAYCSILFLRPRLKITIRREKVRTKIISKSLGHPMRDSYKPERKDPVDITFGFSSEKGRDESYGMMLYYKNRLIKPFVHVGYQKQPDGRGVGVVGVVDVDFLQPIHNKQDFNEDAKYNLAMKAFATKLNVYVDMVMGTDTSSGDQPNGIDVQCDKCLKWRRLSDTFDANTLPEKWYCHNNPDVNYNRCNIPEEKDDEAEIPKITKTMKKDQKQQKRQKQILEKEAEKKKNDQEQTSNHPATPHVKNQRKRRSTEAFPPTTPNKKSTTLKETGEPGLSNTDSSQTHLQTKSQTFLDNMVNSRHQECHESTSREKGLATTSDTVYREKSNYQSDMLEDSVPTGLQDQTEDESQNMSTANAKEVSRSQISCHKAANSFSDPSDVAFETDSQQQSGITSGTEKAMDASRKLDCAQNSDVENNTSTTNASSSKNTDQADIEKVVDMPKSPDQLLEIQALPAKPSFHRNVHKVLQLLHLDIHLGDIANIEAVVEDLLKSPDQLLELQSLRSKLDQLTGKVYRLLQLLNFDVSPGVSAEQAVEKTTRALREGAEACARLDKMKIKVYTLLKILDPNVNLGDVANIEQVVEDMISLHEQD